MRKQARTRYTILAALVIVAGCVDGNRQEMIGSADSAEVGTGEGPGNPGGTGGPLSDADTEDGEDVSDTDTLLLDVGSDSPFPDSGEVCGPWLGDGDAVLVGQVFAPNGELPISGAVITVSSDKPIGIEDGVYCEACVAVDCDAPHTLSAPDGTFELDLMSGTHWISIQKGQFMRAIQVEVAPGSAAMKASDTSLPQRWDPEAGMWIPRIALAWGEYDRLENGLAKLGLAGLDGDSTFAPGTESFDVWTNGSGMNTGSELTTTAKGSFADLLRDPEAMADYHIIFVPCSSSPHENILSNPEIRANVRDWVERGGKWYVSDWSLAFLEEPFPQYQSWWKDQWAGGPLLDAFDTTGKVLDDDLMAWLEALPEELKDINPRNDGGGHPTVTGLPEIELADLWSTIKNTPPVIVEDEDGTEVDVGHKTWIEGPGGGGDGAPRNKDWPLTVTGEYGCGRMLFSSYHTVEWEEDYVGLTPQELVLMYLILEIGVCQVPHAVPLPEG